jgi:hypothetical protein
MRGARIAPALANKIRRWISQALDDAAMVRNGTRKFLQKFMLAFRRKFRDLPNRRCGSVLPEALALRCAVQDAAFDEQPGVRTEMLKSNGTKLAINIRYPKSASHY